VHKNGAKMIVKMLGLHCITADGEAEGFCASLLLAGQVDAIMTEDTDVLAYGCTLMLAFKDYKFSEQKMVGVYLPSVLEHLELNQKEFTDLCILLGCDYNKRIKAWPQDGKDRKKPVCIGMKNALEFIQEFRSLDVIIDFIPDPEPLAYERCRELFIAPSLEGMEMAPYNLEPDYDALEEFFELNKVSVSVEHIRKCYEYCPTHYDDDEGFIRLDDGEVSSEGEEDVFV
jgi:flap endonuclease-1